MMLGLTTAAMGPVVIDTAPVMNADGDATLTIDELASETAVPSRTIRFYQQKGLVPAPVMKGRVAFYGPKHIERLELVAKLQDRGLRIDAIRELVKRLDEGSLDVKDWLGLDAQLTQPWAEDRPRTMSEDELYALYGKKRAGLLKDLTRHAKVERKGDTYLVGSPALVALAGKLEAAGVDLEVSAKANEVLSRHLGKATKELTELFVSHASTDGIDVELGVLIESLRALGPEAVRTVFAREMERSLRELLESGRAAKIPRKKKPRA
jgi:DNA-binding transcriptional MerR regulator